MQGQRIAYLSMLIIFSKLIGYLGSKADKYGEIAILELI